MPHWCAALAYQQPKRYFRAARCGLGLAGPSTPSCPRNPVSTSPMAPSNGHPGGILRRVCPDPEWSIQQCRVLKVHRAVRARQSPRAPQQATLCDRPHESDTAVLQCLHPGRLSGSIQRTLAHFRQAEAYWKLDTHTNGQRASGG